MIHRNSGPVVADLHTHSTASDGVDAPARVVERAAAAGVQAMSLTDHDSVSGVAEAQARGRELGIEVVSGAELTAYVGSREVHILGYRLDIHHEGLLAHCEAFRRQRDWRANEIAKRLEAAGAPIDIERVRAIADGGSIGRPHVARALLEAGHVATMEEAFDRFLGEGKPANVPKAEVSPAQVIAIINEAGGFAVHAHPGIGDQFDLIPEMAKAGLRGVEIIHSAHSVTETARATQLSLNHGLLRTGGSDCHGALPGKDELIGRFGLDASRWITLRRSLHDRG